MLGCGDMENVLWEYATVTEKKTLDAVGLFVFGSKKWELVSVTPVTSGGRASFYYVFKRPLIQIA